MAVLRVRSRLADELREHLGEHAERFAFAFADWTDADDGPAWSVRTIRLIPDAALVSAPGGVELDPEMLVSVVNEAATSGTALIECHSHGGPLPRFSPTDRRGLAEVVPYMLSSLPGRPYAATVWGDGTAWLEYWSDAMHAIGRSIVVADGGQLQQLISRDDDLGDAARTHARQLPWFGASGQRLVGRLRVAICGAGGLGAQIAQLLVYLGVRDFVLVEFDACDPTSMNRLTSAVAADLGTHKGVLARRMIKAVAPGARVTLVDDRVQSADALRALRGSDLIIGAVDNDGARLVLNELALAYEIPYLDAAVGITVDGGAVRDAGGRVVLVRPGDPCLLCYDELDLAEARAALATTGERERARAHGYFTGLDVPAPSVISLNAAAAAAAVNELAVWISGVREPVLYQDIDLLGSGRPAPGQWHTPRRGTSRRQGCVACAVAGLGDRVNVERYESSDRVAVAARHGTQAEESEDGRES